MSKNQNNASLTKTPSQAIGAAKVFGEDESGAGFEGIGGQDLAVPFLNLLQKLSPACDDSDDKYVEGAKPGMWLNTATRKLYPSTIRIIPCLYQRMVVEWKPDRKGFVAQHVPGTEPAEVSRNDKNQPVNAAGNIMVDTRYYFCLLLDEDTGEAEKVVISMSSSQLKTSRTWMTRMQNMKATRADGGKFTPPMYSHVWTLTSTDEAKDDNKWKGMKPELEGPISEEEMYALAKEARVLFKSARTNPEEDGGGAPALLGAGGEDTVKRM